MRTDRRFAQVDVFSPSPGRGNPLAVVQADEGLDAAGMQAMASWFDLAETTFLLPATEAGADSRLRIVTARQEIADEAQVRSMAPDEPAILALAKASDSLGLCVFARTPDADTDLVVRAFPLGVGLREDPASGAANAAIAAFLEESGALGGLGRGYRVSQGREMGRDARLHLELDQEGQVWVGGQCHIVVDGRLHW